MHSRLDYILIEHRQLEAVGNTIIETITTSDHAPVTAEKKIMEKQKKVYTWRLNNALMQDLEIGRKIKKINRTIFYVK